MTTKHRKITERHLAADIIGITMGGFVVDAVTHRSWVSGVVSLVLGAALYVFDRIGIENEETNGN
jgi:hypothetical protein